VKREALASLTAETIKIFHQAFLVDAFGVNAGLVSPDELQRLFERGALDPSLLGGLQIEAGTVKVDPFLFLRLAGRAMSSMSPSELARARDWSLNEWRPIVAAQIPLEAEQRAGEIGGGVSAGAPPRAGELTAPQGRLDVFIAQAEDAARAAGPIPSTGGAKPPPPPPSETGAPPLTPKPPRWLSPQEQAAHSEALSRAGDYARGLGNAWAAEGREAALEGWQGEDISEEVDAETRERMRRLIREETASSIVTERDARKLARDMADRSGYYSHNWERIATTELQGAHNAGRVSDAIDAHGEDAQIARITESGACVHCLRLFRDEDGLPRVFSAAELLANGTNVGRKAADWLPTVWPVHPNCQCDSIPVPFGYYVTEDGRIRKIRAKTSNQSEVSDE